MSDFLEDKITNLIKEYLTDEITHCRVRNRSVEDTANILREKYGARVDIERGLSNYAVIMNITLDIFHRLFRFSYMLASTELDRSGLGVPLNDTIPNYYDRVEDVKLPEELFRID